MKKKKGKKRNKKGTASAKRTVLKARLRQKVKNITVGRR